MLKINIKKSYKSIPENLEFEFPEFTVLTGENGSGKTHLFESINDSKISEILYNGNKMTRIKYIPFNELNPKIDEKCDPLMISQKVKQFMQIIESALQNCKRKNIELSVELSKYEDDPIMRYIGQDQRDPIIRISNRAKIPPSQLTEDIINENISIVDLSGENLFTSQFALLFKAYHVHSIDNKLNKMYIEDGMTDCSEYLNEEEFINKFGEPPWDFVNSILDRLQLPYKVNNPLKTKRDSSFFFKLIHKELGFEISTRDLSTGEKTLMSLALAIYNTTGTGDRAEILVLDEPDAPMHPSMSKLMLEILNEDIAQKHGIPVLLSTHSPTTIACANPKSIYSISKENKEPKKCSLEDTMSVLAYSIPTLIVSMENRRQVFVEHGYDVLYLESLLKILSKVTEFDVLPQFLPPHQHNGSNCSDVIKIVTLLRDLGNSQVYGLVDWDGSNSESDYIKVLGGERRYAIENYVFEPHILALYLIKKGFVTPEILGLTEISSYLDLCRNLTDTTLQQLVNLIEGHMNFSSKPNDRREVELINGMKLNISKIFLEMRGHDLEVFVKSKWPKLNSVRGNGDHVLKLDIISIVCNDFPELLSIDILNTFKSFN